MGWYGAQATGLPKSNAPSAPADAGKRFGRECERIGSSFPIRKLSLMDTRIESYPRFFKCGWCLYPESTLVERE